MDLLCLLLIYYNSFITKRKITPTRSLFPIKIYDGTHGVDPPLFTKVLSSPLLLKQKKE